MLEDALAGGLLRPPDGDLSDEDEFDFEDEVDDVEASEAPGSDLVVGPHTQMRVSSKGEQMQFVGFTLERWLRNRPDGPLQLELEAAETIAAFVFCWSATVTHALAKEPLTLPDLHRTVEILSYETAKEHVEAMERTGLVKAQSSDGEARYAVTDWLREGIAPIVAATRLERHHPDEDTAPPDILDVEAAFQLALPLLKLPGDLSGACRLGVQMPGEEPLLVGATAQVEGGRVVSSSPLLDADPETWATGSPVDWLDTVVDPSADRLEVGGDTRLVRTLLDALHETLFGIPVA